MRHFVLTIAAAATLFAITGAAATTLSVGASRDAAAGVADFVSCDVGTVTVDPVSDGTNLTGFSITSTGGSGSGCTTADTVYAAVVETSVNQRMYLATPVSTLLAGSNGNTLSEPHSVTVPFDVGVTNTDKDARLSVVFNSGGCEGRYANCDYDMNGVYVYTNPANNASGWPISVSSFSGEQTGVLVTFQPQSQITNFGNFG